MDTNSKRQIKLQRTYYISHIHNLLSGTQCLFHVLLLTALNSDKEARKVISKITFRCRSSDSTKQTECEAKTTMKTDMFVGTNQGFQIDISKEHGNWLNVGELIRSIQKPISIYDHEIVQALHEKLCKDFLPVGKCSIPDDCNRTIKSSDLCKSCNSWFKELAALHEKGNNPSWYKNCKSAKWPEDHWEVAKFFMPPLGSNLSTVKDAESTDISSLLNVLEWMKDRAFLGKTRVKVDLIRKLRSEVRNTWAHAPQQEMSDDKMAQGFSIATEFLEDLEKVWSHAETRKCSEHLENLKTSGVTNIAESELQSLLLQRRLLDDIKEEITKIEVERSSEKSTIKKHEQKLQSLERALHECSQRMSNFESFKDNMNEQFNKFAEDLKSFRAIPDDVHEIRNSIGQIRDNLAKMNKRQNEQRGPTSHLPDRLQNFTARAAEIQKCINFLLKEEKAVVSLHGGPGFGKTAIAIEVSHKLSKDYNILVIFSQLTAATSVDDIIRELGLHVGVNNENEDKDPKSSLILWLKNIESEVIFVMDDIDQLLDNEDKSATFYAFVGLLRNLNHNCQIVTTSRIAYKIDDLPTGEVKVDKMDDEECMELLRQHCPEQDEKFLRQLAELCGNVPLAMCIAGSRVDDFEDSDELLQHLQQQPMKTLKCPKINKHVDRAINMSYKKCSDKEKETFVRLAVFDGTFDREAAKAVNEKVDATDILQILVHRSLIEQPLKHRYSIHLLIKHFLVEQQNGEDEIAERANAQATRAELLMVKYFLKLGHDLTMKSYSKDKYKLNREALKKEVRNIQNVLKICFQQSNPTTSDIPDCLALSKVYTISARHFSLFVRTIIAGCTIDRFLQRCADMANEKQQHAIKINFDCLSAHQERIRSIAKSDEYYNMKMEKIEKEFKTYYQGIKEDKAICAHYYYQYGRYLLRKSEREEKFGRLALRVRAREQLEKSLRLRQELAKTPVEIADMVYSLLQLGKIYKNISTTERELLKASDSKLLSGKAQECFQEAIRLSQENLGKHELTSSCYKNLGDLFLTTKEYLKAEEKYIQAKEMRENLGLNANESFVFLLNNLGQCLTINNKATEAIEILESARDMAEKLAENDEQNVCKTKVYAYLAIAYDSIENNIDAVNYAMKALKFEEAIFPKVREKLREIISNNVQTQW